MKDLAEYLEEVIKNSIEAGSDEINITVRYSDEKNVFRFVVEDNGCGMDKTLLKAATDKGISTKAIGHKGEGLYKLKTLVESCEGIFVLSSHPNKYTRLEWTINADKTPIPLGDLADIIAKTIFKNPNIDIHFMYATKHSTFVFFLPAMAYMYKLEKMSTLSDLRKLKKVLKSNILYSNKPTNRE